MATHTDLGKKGEQLAVDYLVQHGYTILHRNWRHSHYEIDIIALKENLLHFVEVKLRSSNQFGNPEESVSKRKTKFLLQAIEQYLYLHKDVKNFHLDILSISMNEKSEPEYFFIEDVYL
ncbi:MAG TPA: YraN family protein [Flavisolibacter sp.]|nr:YraN family protein [Flavisolibacter sp.]